MYIDIEICVALRGTHSDSAIFFSSNDLFSINTHRDFFILCVTGVSACDEHHEQPFICYSHTR